MQEDTLNSGSYQIIMKLSKDTEIQIGALGIIKFKAGYYIYTGSAMKNLSQRIARHKRKNKNKHWHIDYFLDDDNVKILDIKEFPSTKREECRLNLDLLNQKNAEIPAKGFGSSDCRHCPSHLIYFYKISTLDFGLAMTESQKVRKKRCS
jgi:sugar fermentation stimulation protein A